MNLVMPRGDVSSPSFKIRGFKKQNSTQDLTSSKRKKRVFVHAIKQALGVSDQRLPTDRLSDFGTGSRSLKLLTSAEPSLLEERRQSAELLNMKASRGNDLLSLDSAEDELDIRA